MKTIEFFEKKADQEAGEEADLIVIVDHFGHVDSAKVWAPALHMYVNCSAEVTSDPEWLKRINRRFYELKESEKEFALRHPDRSESWPHVEQATSP